MYENACVYQKPHSSSLRHSGYAGELDILNSELLLIVYVHGKQVNCSRIPSSSVCRKEILVSQIVL